MNSPLSVKYCPVNELIPYARNSRTHDPKQIAQIKASIKEFGFTNPILIDEEGVIIAGHGRVLASQEMAMTEVPTITLAGLSKAQRRAYVIADNKLALNAGWDEKMLGLEVADLHALDFNFDAIGFSMEELEAMLANDEDANPGLTDPDDVPELAEEAVTQPGDLWVLGNHRLLCGDSTSIEALERLTEGQRVDMWLTDPPYNVNYEGGTKDALKIKNDNMDNASFRSFLRDAYSAADAVMKSGAVFYIWHADSEGYNFRGAAADIGWTVRQCLIWKKSSLVMGRQDYHWIHEPCLYGWKAGAGHLWASDRKQVTVMDFAKPSKNTEHPTMKPEALFEYQMLNNTKGGDLVLDSFGGSGTTLIAAEKKGRCARLMELDPRYCDVIIKRWQKYTGDQAVLDADGRTFTELAEQREPAEQPDLTE